MVNCPEEEHFSNNNDGSLTTIVYLLLLIVAISLWGKYGREDNSILQFFMAVCCSSFYIFYIFISQVVF